MPKFNLVEISSKKQLNQLFQFSLLWHYLRFLHLVNQMMMGGLVVVAQVAQDAKTVVPLVA